MKKIKRLLAFTLAVTMLLQGGEAVTSYAYGESPAVQEEQTTAVLEVTTSEPPVSTVATTTETPIIMETVYALNRTEASGRKLSLTWYVIQRSADGYYLLRKDNYHNTYETIADIASSKTTFQSYQDSGLTYGVTYTYKVQPYHRKTDGTIVVGNDSPTVKYKVSYAKPTGVSGRRNGSRITVKWKKQSNVSGYMVYEKKNGSSYKKIKTVKKASVNKVTLNKRNKNTDYYYKIKSYVLYDSNRIESGYSEAETVFSTSMQKLNEKFKKLQKRYPDGKYWNLMERPNGDSTTVSSTPCFHSVYGYRYCNRYMCPTGVLGLQCYGFAWKMSDLIYGKKAKYTTHKSFKKAKVGDVIRYSEHSVIITEKHKNYIVVGECNIGGTCIIKWGRRIYPSELSGATYFHRY